MVILYNQSTYTTSICTYLFIQSSCYSYHYSIGRGTEEISQAALLTATSKAEWRVALLPLVKQMGLSCTGSKMLGLEKNMTNYTISFLKNKIK